MKKLMLLMAVAIIALAHRSDGQPAQAVADQLRLAGVMPRGAMVYVQTSDLGALMKMWLASPVRSQFYDSASFAAFQKSRVYLKLQDRKKDFENAIGVRLDENRLAELAGRTSAVSIYDIGKIEMVFASEIPRARAIASAFFKQAAQFQERSAEGTSYYVRDVTTDGGRLNQQFCFAYFEGKLIVTTTEGLMIRAIGNAKAAGTDSLLADVLALAEQTGEFAAHEVTMWLDQARLNRNRYFDDYWIHHNANGALTKIESGLIDVRISREGMIEQRWFKVGNRGRGLGVGQMNAEQLSGLMKFAPSDAQLVEARGQASLDELSLAVEKALFGKLPEQSWSPPEIRDHTRQTSSDDENARAARYSRLDSRFDIDVDDEQAPKRGPGAGGQELGAGKRNIPELGGDFVKSINAILTSGSSGIYAELVRSKADAGKPFLRFERAVVIHMGTRPQALDPLETAIINELRAKFVIAGTEPKLAWQEEGTIRFVAQSLLEQGAAYSVSGDYLVLSSSREFANDILQAAKASTLSTERTDIPVDFYSLIRVASAKPVFDTLMSKLDGRETRRKLTRNKDDEEREVKFFSENLSSLIAASGIREARLSRQSGGVIMTERVVYSW